MFTGLIEEIGTVVSIIGNNSGTVFRIAAPVIATSVRAGDSVAVNGCCLTVTSHLDGQITFDLLGETVARTNLRMLAAGSEVNLERALSADGRLGGHFVQGHVDCTAPVLSFEQRGSDYRLEIELPNEFAHYVAFKGSIALNGISLTVADVSAASLTVWIIPHTRQHTNLQRLSAGDWLNVEFDLLAKYVERMVTRLSPRE
jgi:riboflavin synthase